MKKLENIDFTGLREYNPNWSEQMEISSEKMNTFLACLLHYNLDISMVFRFASNNYTGEFRNLEETEKTLSPLVDKELIENYKKAMLQGCPNHFVAESSRSNAMLYWRKGNNPSINRNLHKVVKTMNKEEN